MTVSPVFHNTRPEGELLPQEAAAFDLLEALHIDYDRVSHDAAFNMELCAQVGDALGVSVCKNLFLCNRQQTKFYLLCMSPDKVFHTKELSAQINSARLSFAPEDKLWELLRCTPGSATILGLANDTEHAVQLLMEREVYEVPYISCHPCLCTSTLRLKSTAKTPTCVSMRAFLQPISARIYFGKTASHRKRARFVQSRGAPPQAYWMSVKAAQRRGCAKRAFCGVCFLMPGGLRAVFYIVHKLHLQSKTFSGILTTFPPGRRHSTLCPGPANEKEEYPP